MIVEGHLYHLASELPFWYMSKTMKGIYSPTKNMRRTRLLVKMNKYYP